jgi:cob(I)alamin adenosyltransferase
MKIYTGTGDTGDTGLYGGERVGKDDVRVEAYGTVDEANAILGVAAAHETLDAELWTIVHRLQSELFTVGADLATPLAREGQAGKSIVPRISASHSTALEMIIDSLEEELPPLRTFILPGGSPAACALHHARAVVRRAERCTVALYHAAPDTMNSEVLRYLNRLADLLFVMARSANYRAKLEDVPWTRPE